MNPMKSYISAAILLLSFTLGVDISSVLAQESVSAEDFDENNNGLIDEGTEQRRLLLQIVNPSFRQLDRNNDGQVTREEVDEAIADPNPPTGSSRNVLRDTNSDLNQLRSNNDGQLMLDTVNTAFFTEPEEPVTGGLAGFRLRRSLEDATIVDNLAPFAEADAASLSFVQDFEEDNSIITARAALFRPFRIETGQTGNDGLALTAYQLTPGVEIDRIEESGSDDGDEDILAFALNTDFEVQGSDIFPSQYFRANLLYETDLDFDSGIIGGIIQWEPVRSNVGLGARVRKLFGLPIDVRWRGMIEAQIASVLDAGDIEDVNDDDFLFRIGPRLEVEFFPNTSSDFLNRFGLQADYSFLQRISGDSETIDLFDTTLSFRIDDNGNTNFEVNYRVGEIALTGQDVEELTFGFSFKF